MTENLTGRGRTVRRIAAAALTVLSLGVVGCDKFKSKQLIREGNAYFKEQLYDDALKKYEAAQALDPTEVRLDKFVAMGYMALYNPGSTHPKDLEALSRSIEHFKKYLAAKPDDEKAARFLVTTYMNAQKYDEAIKYFKELVEKHPQDSQAVQTIAMLYAKQGDYENSIEWQKKRGELEPNNAEAFYTMGHGVDKSYNTPGTDISPDKGLTPEKAKEIRRLRPTGGRGRHPWAGPPRTPPGGARRSRRWWRSPVRGPPRGPSRPRGTPSAARRAVRGARRSVRGSGSRPSP